jgi:hypothetical protein
MTKYEEIANAFSLHQDAAWSLRDKAEAVARQLFYAIGTIGGVPNERFGFAPAEEEFDAKKRYDPNLAVTFSEQGRWEIHYFLDIRKGEVVLPSALFLFVVTLLPEGDNFRAKVIGPKEPIEKLIEPNKPDPGINEFAERILEGILRHYTEMAANPLPSPRSGDRQVLGFASAK